MGVKMRFFGCAEATLITMKLCGAIASEYMGVEIRSSKFTFITIKFYITWLVFVYMT